MEGQTIEGDPNFRVHLSSGPLLTPPTALKSPPTLRGGGWCLTDLPSYSPGGLTSQDHLAQQRAVFGLLPGGNMSPRSWFRTKNL